MLSSTTNTTGDEKKLDIELFLTAQEWKWDDALDEIKSGEKISHWIWFIWPQLPGLGTSRMAQTYAIPSLEAAKEYLDHEVLGTRLQEITEAALNWNSNGEDIKVLMGSETDNMKFQSSMTLFMRASDKEDNIFKKVLEKYYGGDVDTATDDKLAELQANTTTRGLTQNPDMEDTIKQPPTPPSPHVS